MRLVRFLSGGQAAYGLIEAETIFHLEGSPFEACTRGAAVGPLDRVELLAPCQPSKIVAIGRNYVEHAREHQAEVPAEPLIFLKPPSAVIAYNQSIVLPPQSKQVEHEAELAVVIGKRAKNVGVKDAKSYVFGVTIGNDVSERDWQKQDLQWFRAKATDTFGPLGPAIATGLNYDDVLLQTKLNGEVVQSQRTKDLIFDVAAIVSYLSRYITLEPGDVIFTGTPGTTRAFKPGDVIEVEIEGIGTLRNRAVLGGS